ncbi:hypothetical protein ACFO25_07595 [Paenactinomyces guangxiensis]|uniref:Uncharacterized protein n=1 Tax=Paenactinomyces guangxiensis TaxID=1490290 RepID=A0A7W1WNJ5_9BACL|nr:hypothetical protein [Paenactinomyces guangxiensis]MBA4493091.1 hypothetical protein [Paenactinomyces guangxiensis]MBH8590059.1 hypothetical protein [Paenactinomyces guangxiensis]
MIKMQVEGRADQVQSFLCQLEQGSQVKLVHKEWEDKEMSQPDEVCFKCYVQKQPDQQMRIVQLVTAGGGEIRIPLFDVIHAEIEEGVKVFAGRNFDMFP